MTDAPELAEGTRAPDVTLPDQNGNPVTLSDFRGQKVILYFYPAAETPGCTKQACDFRDNTSLFTTAGYAVVGISPDPVAKQAHFSDAHHLPFPLLCDTERIVHNAYGTYGHKNLYGKLVKGVKRSTFVIDEDGIIRLALYNVRATGHVASLTKKLGLATP